MRLPGIQVLSLRTTLMLALISVLCPLAQSAQEPRPQEQVAPPPLKIVTRAERHQLDAAKDEKNRIKLTIELAEAHLANAEHKTAEQQYDAAAAEAGMYWALIEDAFSFMKTIDRENNKKRDLYKRLELSLRAHGPRLSAIRRGTPAEYAIWIKEIEDLARNGRTEALNSFYGHTVLRETPLKSTDARDLVKPPPKN